MQAPLGIEIFDLALEKRQELGDLESAELRNYGMKRDRIADDGGDLGDQAGDGGHHEAGGALAVDHRLDLVPSGFLNDLFDRARMIVDGGLIEVPGIGLEIDAGAPVFQPDVVAAVDEVVDHGSLYGGAKQIGADARSMSQQDRSPGGWMGALHVDEVAGEAVAGFKRDDLLAESLLHGFPRGEEMEEKFRAQTAKRPQNSESKVTG